VPKVARDSPEGVRTLLDWFARESAERPDGARRCFNQNVFTLLTGGSPRSESLDAAFEEYRHRGHLLGAAVVLHLDSFDEQVALIASEDRCVRNAVTSRLLYMLRDAARAEGRVVGSEERRAIQDAVAGNSGPDVSFDEAKPPRIWRNFAVVETSSASRTDVHLLRRNGEGWEYLGSQLLTIA
jgi:hypothetical protein